MAKTFFTFYLIFHSLTQPLLSACITALDVSEIIYYYTANKEKTGDYYIDQISGKLLGRDGRQTSNLRIIDKREWKFIKKKNGGIKSKKAIQELHKISLLVTINEEQIQREIQILADDTARENLEHLLYVVLDINTGKIFAKRERDPSKIFEDKAHVDIYKFKFKNSAPRIAEGLLLLTLVHGHPKTLIDNHQNLRSVSDLDKASAKSLGISIFAIDAFDRSKPINHQRDIHKVSKLGYQKKYVGKTKGKDGNNTFNFSSYIMDMLKKNRYQ